MPKSSAKFNEPRLDNHREKQTACKGRRHGSHREKDRIPKRGPEVMILQQIEIMFEANPFRRPHNIPVHQADDEGHQQRQIAEKREEHKRHE
jgi:hypothetical protein